MTKTNISIVSETYRPEINGVANTLGYWVDGLIERGFKVQIIRPRQHSLDHGKQTVHEHEITTFGLPIPKYSELRFGLPSAGLFYKLWSNDRPAAVYVATEGPLGWSAARVARKLQIRVISGFHTNFQSYSQFYGFGWLERLILRYLKHFHNETQCTLVPTTTQANYLVANGFHNVRVISRGVDCERFHPAKRSNTLRDSWGAKKDDLVCIYVGRLANEKNVGLISKTVSELTLRGQPMKLVFVGDGPARVDLEKNCPNAVFAGMQRGEALAQYYASADVFLFPSKTDTFGNVVTEAMASGLCVVAFDDAAAKEHLKHKESGLISDMSKDSEFIDNVHYALSHPEHLAQFRKNSLALAQKISWHEIVDQFTSTLLSRDAISERGKRNAPAEKLNSC